MKEDAKLALLEGDRKVYLESSQAAAKSNAQKIAELRKENKALIARLKSLKDPGVAASFQPGPKAIQLLDLKAAEQIKKNNALRHQAASKAKRIEEIEKLIRQIQLEEGPGKAGGADSQLRELENRLDKALIKTQEAQFIGKTYKQITEKLQQDRLTFDGRVTALEQAIVARRQEIARLEAMLSDATVARDTARADLTRAEQEAVAARATREQEKKRLQALAEERRRQYEALEKRMRLASVGEEKEELDQTLPQDVTLRLAAYEKAFARVQDVTGVAEPDDVLARFAAQSQTAAHLQTLTAQNSAALERLKAEHDAAAARLEAVQFSGEEHAASSRAELATCEARAAKAAARLDTVRAEAEAAQKQLAVVTAGIEHLLDKLYRAEPKPAQPAALPARLALAADMLKSLVRDLGARQDQLAAMHNEDLLSIVELPAHNVRVQLLSSSKDADELSESGDEDESSSREAIKRQAASLVEAKTAKPKKKKGKDDDED